MGKIASNVSCILYLETVNKRKATGARCEGKSIPGLAKIRKWKYSEKEKDLQTTGVDKSSLKRSEVEDEDYVLGKLLKKSLVNGAMKHDTIVDACELNSLDHSCWLNIETVLLIRD